ncbi:MAG: TolB family protein [Dehalococcoidia bacterium]
MTRRNLYAAGVLAGLGVLAVLVVVVFAFGRRHPSPPSLTDNPRREIPGEILYLDREGCYIRTEASGASREKLICLPQLFPSDPLYWPDEQHAGVLQYEQGGPVLWTIDLATGAMQDTGKVISPATGKPSPPGLYGGAFAPDGTYAYTDDKGVLHLVADGENTSVTEFDTADYQQPHVILWSPDSQWMALNYYPSRGAGTELWIVSRDGAIKGTLAKNMRSGSIAWRIGSAVSPPVPD